MPKHCIAWWNVENLFDVQNSPNRPAWLQSKLNSELAGWTAAVLDLKINQIASVIMLMNQGKGPDIIGMCEVENKPVLEKLVNALSPLGRNYIVKHHEGNDQRGIDIAFIVDKDLYEVEEQVFHYEVLKRSATRDIIQINIKTKKGREIFLIGNHWPARSAGQYESEPFRIMAAETLSYWLSRIFEIKTDRAAVVVMGDFNDEPFNRSMRDYAQSTPSRTRTNRGRMPYLYNLCEEWIPKVYGSYVFGNEQLMIDQIMVTKGISLTTGHFDLNRSNIEVFQLQGMVSGLYHAPVRFGRPSSGYNPTGYSDHLPLVFNLYEK
jgi:predicted extracellular nuclease